MLLQLSRTALTPDELHLFKNDANTKVLKTSVLQEGWCQHFNQDTRLCDLGDKRPVACKTYVCSSINEKIQMKNGVQEQTPSLTDFESHRERLENFADTILRLSNDIITVTTPFITSMTFSWALISLQSWDIQATRD
jgi:hypothetical protein